MAGPNLIHHVTDASERIKGGDSFALDVDFPQQLAHSQQRVSFNLRLNIYHFPPPTL